MTELLPENTSLPTKASHQLSDFKADLTSWQNSLTQLSEIRFEVFVDEQKVPADEEIDELDAVSVHALVSTEDGTPVGCARLLPDGHIGRMAVRKPFRGVGVGLLLLDILIDHAKQQGQHDKLELHAQTHALAFYTKRGFEVVSDTFLDAGIEHKTMRLAL